MKKVQKLFITIFGSVSVLWIPTTPGQQAVDANGAPVGSTGPSRGGNKASTGIHAAPTDGAASSRPATANVGKAVTGTSSGPSIPVTSPAEANPSAGGSALSPRQFNNLNATINGGGAESAARAG